MDPENNLEDRLRGLEHRVDDLESGPGVMGMLSDNEEIVEWAANAAETYAETVGHPEIKLGERSDADFYPTPYALCRAALDLLPNNFKPNSILDAGAGEGPWGVAARDKWPHAFICGIEARPVEKPDAYDVWYVGDFLTVKTPYLFDLALGNPPYGKNHENVKVRGLAELFVRRQMQSLYQGTDSYLLNLLLLNFITTAERVNTLFQEYPPFNVVPLMQRPSFKPGWDKRTQKVKPNATDTREYMILIMKSGNKDRKFRWLDWK